MPVYNPNRLEYSINQGHVAIIRDDGRPLPAYFSHPDIGGSRFPAVALIHDWWGITNVERRLANLFAQMGYYVIVPDLFAGRVANNAQEALALVESLADDGYPCVDTALVAVEHHAKTNSEVAVIGLGMGGSLAFEAALTRGDLEAAVSLYGFPQRYLGHFKEAKAPILAIYGADEPHVSPAVITQLQSEFAESPMEHECVILPDAARDFFTTPLDLEAENSGTRAWNTMLAFLDRHVPLPAPKQQKRY